MPRSAASTPSCTWRTGCGSKAWTSRSAGGCGAGSGPSRSWRGSDGPGVERVHRERRRHRRPRAGHAPAVPGGHPGRARLVLLAALGAPPLAPPALAPAALAPPALAVAVAAPPAAGPGGRPGSGAAPARHRWPAGPAGRGPAVAGRPAGGAGTVCGGHPGAPARHRPRAGRRRRGHQPARVDGHRAGLRRRSRAATGPPAAFRGEPAVLRHLVRAAAGDRRTRRADAGTRVAGARRAGTGTGRESPVTAAVRAPTGAPAPPRARRPRSWRWLRLTIPFAVVGPLVIGTLLGQAMPE